MGWMSFLKRLRNWRAFDRWALEIAQRSQDSVWQQVKLRVMSMPLAEARGYVRARSLPIVQKTLSAVATGEPDVANLDRQALLLAASDQVASLILRNLPKVTAGRRPIGKAA